MSSPAKNTRSQTKRASESPSPLKSSSTPAPLTTAITTTTDSARKRGVRAKIDHAAGGDTAVPPTGGSSSGQGISQSPSTSRRGGQVVDGTGTDANGVLTEDEDETLPAVQPEAATPGLQPPQQQRKGRAQQPPSDQPALRRNRFSCWSWDKTSAFKFVAFLVGSLVLIFIGDRLGTHFSSTTSAPQSTPPLSIDKDSGERFTRQLKQIFAKKFYLQDEDTQLSLLSQGLTVLDPDREPVQPSAITILVPPTVPMEFASCFARTIGSTLNKAFRRPSPPPKELSASTFQSAPDVTFLHDTLKSYLNSTGNVVIFHDLLDLTTEEHINVFHAFCDNFRAPFKRATFFFLLQVPPDLYKESTYIFEQGGQLANTILDVGWKHVLSADKRPAIISRITPTVILLKEGDQCFG